MNPWELWKKAFGAWERSASNYFDEVVRNPLLLSPPAYALSALMKLKAKADSHTASGWRMVGLPTRRDQERTVHLLGELQSQLLDLQEEIEDLRAAMQSAEATPTTEGDESNPVQP